MLDTRPVFDVVEQDGEIVHWTAGNLDSAVVRGRINWPRRFDHMQQHTGQHILSQAFLRTLNAQTVSFHLGEESSTIDLDCGTLEMQEATSVENMANEIIFANRPVSARFVTAKQLTELTLRKGPTVDKDIRIVQIEGFDASPCGGTHCSHTGEVGLIAMRKWERRGSETRVEFLCGWRALRDHHWKTEAINQLALAFSVKDQELSAAILRLVEEATASRRELHHLRARLLDVEAEELLRQATQWADHAIVLHAFHEREPQEVRKLASTLMQESRTIILLGISGAKARVVFGRSADTAVDMAELLKETCRQFGGRGGGQPSLAQGGGFDGKLVDQALQWAYQKLTARQGRD
jgi:alanyl-tRNA synthetase